MSDPHLSRSEADAVHEQALLGVEPVQLMPVSKTFDVIDLTNEEVLVASGYKERLRPLSNYSFHDIKSFTDYVNGIFARRTAEAMPTQDGDYKAYRPLRSHALCIADEAALTIRLTFDAQPNEWGYVHADLKLQIAPEAQRWLASSGLYMTQQDFAEFCELNLESFASPAAATILEIAQTFQAKTTVDFGSAVRLSNGAIKLKREEKVEATAGERADITIPEELRLALPIFKYDKTYEVRARLRYRVRESAVHLSVLLIDPEMALEHAFREVANEISRLLDMPVFWGKV